MPEHFNFDEKDDIGLYLYETLASIYPFHRSITGNGVRKTLRFIQNKFPLDIIEVPTGTKVFDWVVPQEWNLKDAYVKDSSGKRIIDYRRHNLHVVNSSSPVSTILKLGQLRPHLHTLPEQPNVIPYRYTHYNKNWGFCLSHDDYRDLKEDNYQVCIDSTVTDGFLTYGEFLARGSTKKEILISCHICHPSLANDNASGIAIAAGLAEHLSKMYLKNSYRFIFVPSTIGAITWLARNEDKLANIDSGLVLAGVGDPGHVTYKRSRRGNSEVDRAVEHVLKHCGEPHKILDFSPYGYDERQFNSPAFDLGVGLFSRSKHDDYPQYHTSADNLDFVHPVYLEDSFRKCVETIRILEENGMYFNTKPKGEPNLGKRGLYRDISGQADNRCAEIDLLWVLNYSDGSHDLLDIADRANVNFQRIRKAADRLIRAGLLTK